MKEGVQRRVEGMVLELMGLEYEERLKSFGYSVSKPVSDTQTWKLGKNWERKSNCIEYPNYWRR